MRRAWAAALLVVGVLAAGLGSASAGKWTVDVPTDVHGQIAVAPTGNVYLAGSGGTGIYDRWGESLAEVDAGDPDSEMVWLDGAMYVLAFDEVAEIDGTTHAVTATFPAPTASAGVPLV